MSSTPEAIPDDAFEASQNRQREEFNRYMTKAEIMDEWGLTEEDFEDMFTE